MEKSTTATPPIRKVGLDMLRTMLRIRLFEEGLYRLFMSGTMPGTMHQAIGEEAISAAVGAAIRPDDLMTSSHRGHGHAIAKGLPLTELMAEMFGHSNGSSRGMGGSMHVFDLPRGFLGSTGVVGAGVPIAVGAALASHLEGSDRAVVAFFGDGAANQGAVHEALNLASVWRLPIVFVCENNGYAVSLPFRASSAVERLSERAPGYGMHGVTVDGQDAFAVLDAIRPALARARGGEGPSLVECLTYRYKGHSRFEPAQYREPGELEEWLAKDPIERLERRLGEEGGVGRDEIDALHAQVEREVADAIAFGRAGTPLEIEEIRQMAFVR